MFVCLAQSESRIARQTEPKRNESTTEYGARAQVERRSKTDTRQAALRAIGTRKGGQRATTGTRENPTVTSTARRTKQRTEQIAETRDRERSPSKEGTTRSPRVALVKTTPHHGTTNAHARTWNGKRQTHVRPQRPPQAEPTSWSHEWHGRGVGKSDFTRSNGGDPEPTESRRRRHAVRTTISLTTTTCN